MPVKQAEINSCRREVSVGIEEGVVVLVLAINIFVGLGSGSSGGTSGPETGTGNLGTADWISPAAVENGGALGHDLVGRIRGRHGEKSRTAAAPETRFQRPRIAPRSPAN